MCTGNRELHYPGKKRPISAPRRGKSRPKKPQPWLKSFTPGMLLSESRSQLGAAMSTYGETYVSVCDLFVIWVLPHLTW